MNNTANNRDVSLTCSKELLNLFEKESRENSKVPLETLGILMGKKTGENSFSVENLLLPPQNANTAISCEMTDDAPLVALVEQLRKHYKDEVSSLGFIHSHPRMSSFLSTIDLNNLFSWQTQHNLPFKVSLVLGIFNISCLTCRWLLLLPMLHCTLMAN